MNPTICFLGTGKINEKHIRIVKKLEPGIKIAVASRTQSRAEDFASQMKLDAYFGSYDEALASDYSTLVIGVPPSLHAGLIEGALKAQKNLLIEKPVFNSLGEFIKLWPLLKQSPHVIMVAENQHFDPFHVKIKNILKNEDWGRPVSLDLVRLGLQKNTGWRQDPKEMPLGALHEGGVHWIRRLLDLAGVFEKEGSTLESLDAYGPLKPLSLTPHEDTVMVLARHPSGLSTRLFHSWGIPKRLSLFEMSKVYMEKGAIYFDGRGAYGFVFGPGRRKRILFPQLHDLGGYKAMWRHFLDCLAHKTKPHLSLEDVYFDFSYLDAAYRSLKSQRAEKLIGLPELVL